VRHGQNRSPLSIWHLAPGCHALALVAIALEKSSHKRYRRLMRRRRPFATVTTLSAALPLSLVAGLLLLAPSALADDGAWRAFKGKIVVSDQEFGTGFPTDAAMVKAIKKQSKSAIKGEGAWTLHMMVFLKEAPGAESVNIVYYDMSARPPEQVNYSEVSVQPKQKTIQINGVAISKDLGFVKGHKYEVRATRLIDGKEKVYAKTTLTLK
jgi:hypothetical protein